MPLFTHQSTRSKPRKSSLRSKLKKLFHKTPNLGIEASDEFHGFIDRFRIMFLRSMIVLITGCSWWVAAPAIFLSLLPGFALYGQWLINYHTSIVAVYQFWQVVPEILLFSFGTIWTSGVVDMIVGNKPLEKVF